MTKTFFEKLKILIRIIIILLLIGITGISSLSIFNTPAIKPLELSSEEFSAESSWRHLEVIAMEAHPVGSAENLKVRDYIMREIAELGLEAVTQYSYTNLPWGENDVELGNVFTRIKGYDNSKAVLVVSHYDSVSTGPGAGDDGVAVAAMLESLKLIQGKRFKNDLIFLFTDGEEAGLLGAKEFVKRNPLDEIGLVLNFEARGTSGPSIMFETSNDNGFLIRHFARAVDAPLATSVSYEIYRRMPNDTDFSIFNQEGIPGLNFAFIGDGMYYHTIFDNIENVDMGSLQHHGEYIVSLLNRFGNMDLDNIREEDRVYFTVPGKIIVHYPVKIVIPLLILLTAFLLILLIRAINKNIITSKSLAIHFSWLTLFIPLSIFLNYIIWQIAKFILEIPAYEYYFHEFNFTKYLYYSSELFSAFVVAEFLLLYLLYILLRKRFELNHLTIASIIWFYIFALITGFFLPGASYLFTWPLAFVLVALIIVYYRDYQDKKIALTISALLSFLTLVVLILPILVLFNEALGYMIIPLLGLLSPLIFIIIPHLDYAYWSQRKEYYMDKEIDLAPISSREV